MKIYVAFTKSRIITAVVIFLLLLCIGVRITAAVGGECDADTAEKRLKIIEELDISVEPTVSEKQITIPYEFSDVYEKYNELQLASGYNLKDYRGKTAVIYTYQVVEKNALVNLIVCDGMLIGGDITETALGGEMKPLLECNNGKTKT